VLGTTSGLIAYQLFLWLDAKTAQYMTIQTIEQLLQPVSDENAPFSLWPTHEAKVDDIVNIDNFLLMLSICSTTLPYLHSDTS
jgi:hypothetical protein